MVKEKERDEKEQQQKEKKIMVGCVWNWSSADMKLLLASLLVIFFLVPILLQFLPVRSFLSPSQFRSCLSQISLNSSPLNVSTIPNNPPHSLLQQQQQQQQPHNSSADLIVKRAFNPVGSAAYLFVQMGAYRGGLNTFAVVGLASKPIHVFSKPDFRCRWIPHHNRSASVSGAAYKMLPDWGYGRVYTVVVVNCTFPLNVGADGSGGQLLITATSGGGDGPAPAEETFVALEEAPGSVNASVFASPPKYDYLYCGSPLYGDLSPQRVREWMAYHAKLFGMNSNNNKNRRSHFVIHDAGGVHLEVMAVLRPWIDKGLVTLQDIRDQESFDGYYHNQFLVVNDCLHRYRYDAKWIFFFDVDEFLYVEPWTNLDSLMNSLSGFTQFTIQQMPMSSKLCLSQDANITDRMWGIEKLVYKDVKKGIRRDRKYAIQPRHAFSAGVHLSQNFEGKTTHKVEGKIKYFHYHGTIANRREPCREFVNATELTFEGTPYYRDDTLRRLAVSIKRFELKKIGKRLMTTRQ